MVIAAGKIKMDAAEIFTNTRLKLLLDGKRIAEETIKDLVQKTCS